MYFIYLFEFWSILQNRAFLHIGKSKMHFYERQDQEIHIKSNDDAGWLIDCELVDEEVSIWCLLQLNLTTRGHCVCWSDCCLEKACFTQPLPGKYADLGFTPQVPIAGDRVRGSFTERRWKTQVAYHRTTSRLGSFTEQGQLFRRAVTTSDSFSEVRWRQDSFTESGNEHWSCNSRQVYITIKRTFDRSDHQPHYSATISC